MGALAILAQLLTLSNTLTPLIAGLVGQIKTEHPELTEEQILAQATALALETRSITEQDMGPV